jgi:hypothetical protein
VTSKAERTSIGRERKAGGRRASPRRAAIALKTSIPARPMVRRTWPKGRPRAAALTKTSSTAKPAIEAVM